MSSRRLVVALAAALTLVLGCSGSTTPDTPDTGEGIDAGTGGVDTGTGAADTGTGASDTGTTDVDTGVVTDDAGDDAAASDVDAWCVPPPCAAPPPGCTYVGAGPCDCGTLECAPSGCSPACATGDYCDYCGATTMCKPLPTPTGGICPDIYDPQCGCDGNTYSNTCALADAMMQLWYAGECTATPPPAPADECAVDRDCHGSDTCQACRTTSGVRNVCLPRGSVC